MPVQTLELKTLVSTLKISNYWPNTISFTLHDFNGIIVGQAPLDRSQAYLLLLYLQEHLTVGKSDYSIELDKVIEEEMKNKPKDIMR